MIKYRLALLSDSETFVYYTVQIYYPVRERKKKTRAARSLPPADLVTSAERSLPKSAGGPQTAASID